MEELIAVYVRESSDKQADNWTNKRQIEQGKAFAKSEGLPYKLYEDIKSGKADSLRPQWEKLKKDISAGKVSVLWFYKYERLGRDNEENERIKKLLVKHSVKLYSAEDGGYLDLNNTGTDLVTTVKGKLAELENKTKSDYVRKALKQKHDSGDRRYSKLYGYTATSEIVGDKIKREWHIAEQEAQVIRYAFKLALEDHLGLSAICRRLNDEGHRTRNNKTWTHDKIRNLLTHEQYAGLTRDSQGNLIASTAYEAIIAPEAWQRLQTIYPAFISSGKKGRPNSFPGSGIMVCPYCGSKYVHWNGYQYRMVGGIKKKIDKISYNHISRSACKGVKYYQAKVIDSILEQAYSNILKDKDYIVALLKIGQKAKAKNTEEAERIKSLIDSNKRKKGNLLSLAENGVDMADIASRVRELSAIITELETRYDALQGEIDLTNNAIAKTITHFQELKIEAYSKADGASKNKLLRALIDKVEAKDNNIIIHLRGVDKTYTFDYASIRDEKKGKA